MKNSILDFKNFKKISEDKEGAILQNDKGHKIHLVKSSLSPVLQKQLSRLPLHQYDPDSAIQPPAEEDSQQPVEDPSQSLQPDPNKGVTININSGQTPQQVQPLAQPQPQPQPEQKVPGILQASQGVPPAQQPPQALQQPEQAPQDPYTAIPGYPEQSQGIKESAEALQQQGQQVAALHQQHAADEQVHLAQLQKELAEKTSTIKAVTDDIGKGHINPNQYLQDMGVPGKISTAIGLILGGIGAGKHGNNAALTYLNSQIERDVSSQKADMANKHNLLSALNKQYDDTVVAENMFRAIRANTLADQVAAASATSQGALAKATGSTAAGALKQQASQYLRQAQLAGMQAGVQKSTPGSDMDSKANAYLQAARVVDPKNAEEFEKRYVPGVGVASVPLEPKDRELLQKKTELHELLRKSGDFLQDSGKLGPILPARKAEGTALQNQINLKMGELANLTRFTPEENKIYQRSVPDLTGTHLTESDMTLLKGLQEENDTSLNTLYKQKGINQVSTSNPMIKGANGKMYRKSPDGKYMVPVK